MISSHENVKNRF